MSKFWDDDVTASTIEDLLGRGKYRSPASDFLHRHFESNQSLSVRVTTNTSAASILEMGPGLLVGFATIIQGPITLKADIFTGESRVGILRPAFRVAPRAGWSIDDSGVWVNVCQTVAQIILDMAVQERARTPPPPPPGATRSAPDGLPWSALGLDGPVERGAASAAFRAKAKQVHPDVAKGDGQAMRELLAAWERIKQAKGWR